MCQPIVSILQEDCRMCYVCTIILDTHWLQRYNKNKPLHDPDSYCTICTVSVNQNIQWVSLLMPRGTRCIIHTVSGICFRIRQQLASLVRVPESRKWIIETAENRIPKFYFLITSVHDHGATWSIFRLAISTVLSSWSRTRCEPRLWEAWSYPKLSRRAKVNGSFRKHFLIRTNFPELCRLREYVD